MVKLEWYRSETKLFFSIETQILKFHKFIIYYVNGLLMTKESNENDIWDYE